MQQFSISDEKKTTAYRKASMQLIVIKQGPRFYNKIVPYSHSRYIIVKNITGGTIIPIFVL